MRGLRGSRGLRGERPRPARPGVRGLVPALVLPAVLVGTLVGGPASPPAHAAAGDASAGPLHARGATLVDARGRPVTLTGVNWFGFETTAFAPGGLGARSWNSILDQMVAAGFNTLRLPYTNQLFADSSRPSGIDYGRNPDLQGLQGLALMDRIVKGATDRGLMVLLDQHRPDPHGQGELWYTDHLSEAQWIRDWTMLARHYRGNPRVIGADLRNEPHGRATWGSGDRSTDWRLAAERAGNAVLRANPNWLVVVEGISNGYWWGGTLTGARRYPVRLSRQDKLVYSAHDYGPGVWQQTWFKAANFPANMPALWRREWAYLAMDGTAPVLMGEFGGRSVDPGTVEGKWQRALMGFLQQEGISYTYWAWNPESEDTGGIVKDDWTTLDKAKLAMLKKYQAPLLDAPYTAVSRPGTSGPATKPAPASGSSSGGDGGNAVGDGGDVVRDSGDVIRSGADVGGDGSYVVGPGSYVVGPGSYVVRPGDTLDGIARARHVVGGWPAIWKLNRGRVHNPDLIWPGQRLRLP